MRPYWLFFVALAIVLAFWGTKHRNVGFKESADDEFDKKSNGELFKITLPAIFLLFAVIFGPIVNDLIGFCLLYATCIHDFNISFNFLMYRFLNEQICRSDGRWVYIYFDSFYSK